MIHPRTLVTVTIPEYFSAWLWRTFRRPRRFLLLLVMLPLLIVVFTTHHVHIAMFEAQALQHLGVTARLAAEVVDETFNATLRAERILIARPGFITAVQRRDREAITPHLAATLPMISRAEVATVIGPNGRVLAVFPDRPGLIGESVAEQDAFRGGRHRQQPYVASVSLREGSAMERVVGVVQPITAAGRVVGFLQLQHRIEEVASWLKRIHVEPEGFLYVVDHHRQMVGFPLELAAGSAGSVWEWPTVQRPLTETGAEFTFTSEGKTWLAAAELVGSTGWRVVAVQPREAALRALLRVFWILTLLVGGLFVLVVAIIFRWAQLHAFCLRLLRQNAKLLKQSHQRQTLEASARAAARSSRSM